METKDIILELRTKNGLSQEELAEKVFVTRQAVSRWENGDTIPNTETLKLLSKLFDVSINTLAISSNPNSAETVASDLPQVWIFYLFAPMKRVARTPSLWFIKKDENKAAFLSPCF